MVVNIEAVNNVVNSEVVHNKGSNSQVADNAAVNGDVIKVVVNNVTINCLLTV